MRLMNLKQLNRVSIHNINYEECFLLLNLSKK